MKNKKLYIVGSIIIVLVILFLIIKKKFMKPKIKDEHKTVHNSKIYGKYTTVDEQAIIKPSDRELYTYFRSLILRKGRDYAQNLEKILRLETGHMQAEVWRKTAAGGILAFNNEFPFNWHYELEKFWYDNKECQPVGIIKGAEDKYLLQFTGLGGIKSMEQILSTKDRPGAYYATSDYPHLQERYENNLQNIILEYTA